MVRNISDFETPRRTRFCYQELGRIKNLIASSGGKIKCGGDGKIFKLGVQSRPGFMMCINGEEIHISRTGIYEINNGVLPITFFCAVKVADETSSDIDDWKEHDETQGDYFSYCAFGSAKELKLDPFTVDYMYKTN